MDQVRGVIVTVPAYYGEAGALLVNSGGDDPSAVCVCVFANQEWTEQVHSKRMYHTNHLKDTRESLWVYCMLL